jgi:M6 family metalloprotease-like protein
LPARPIPHARWLLVALALGAGATPAFAQDVEMLGRRYGTQPPAGYFQERARNPDAFRFTRGRAEPARMLEAARTMQSGTAVRAFGAGAPARALGPRDPVVGTYRIPMLLGLYSDSPPGNPLYNRQQVQTAFFDAPSGTVTEYYDEVSGGALDLVGETRDWTRAAATHTQSAVTQGQSALVCCGIGDFIKDLISLQGNLNWGVFDNDGPDGVPNSGDDDGYVDALAIMHPDRGAECGGVGSSSRIWSHKWTLTDASSSRQPYATSSPRTGGGFILIEDYFVQGLLSCPAGPPRACDPGCLNEIGVFAHEAGHAFGLPDLYDTRPSGTPHSGAGNWEVMSHGTWGCDDRTPAQPCHMGAWSKAMLGWVDVITLDPDMDHGVLSLPPVETSGIVYRIDAQDGSGEYFLIENRQRIGYDQRLFEEGLLVWQIDANALAQRWTSNLVNAYSDMAVWIRQADGREHLSTLALSAGDAGDPFPGGTGNTAFHAVSLPSSNSRDGNFSGLTLFDIRIVGDAVDFHALTRLTRMTVRPAGSSANGLFMVDGDALGGSPPHVVLSPPFTSRTIEAAIGEIVRPGERRPFVQWTDAPSAPRTRVVVTPVVDTDYEAAFGAIQYQLAIPMAGGINGVEPGVVTTTPASSDLWFAPNTVVDLSIAARTGFSFLDWTDALAGRTNPTTVTLDAPIFGGANFQLTYAVADVDLAIPAAVAQDLQLVAANGTPPILWSVVAGSLPPGIGLSDFGRLTGAAVAAGAFPVTVEAADGLGLTDQASIDFQVADPTLSIEALAARFVLSGAAIDALQEAYVDYQGNGNGAYDLGDFRAWVLAHPSLPMSASIVASPRASIVAVPVDLAGEAVAGNGPSNGGRP